jgi:hypothetical protein
MQDVMIMCWCNAHANVHLLLKLGAAVMRPEFSGSEGTALGIACGVKPH